VTCKICGKISEKIFRRKILLKYDVDYFQCPQCKFIQTEEPFWLQEAYEHSINIEDTGLVDRNILFAKRSTMLLYILFNRKDMFLDYGGGYGLFVRLMRDYGFDFFWKDPFTENIFARGFEFDPEKQKQLGIVSTFECFEHFVNPLSEIEKMLSLSDSLLFSTEIFQGSAPSPEEWEYYYFSHGQHVALYSFESLLVIAKKFNMNLCSNGKSFHLLTPKRINNTLFNVLLKISLIGLPSVIKYMIGSKTKSDSLIGQGFRKNVM
jgi:hypothetical protein